METTEENLSPEDKKDARNGKIFLIAFGLIILGSVAFTYWKIVIKKNYMITAQADCDPYTEKCFVHVCNPDPAVDGECTGDPVEDTWYTKNIKRIVGNIPDCDPKTDDTCTALVCGEGEKDCSYELCDATNVPEGDTCNDPAEYTKNNPPAEDDATVDDGANDSGDSEPVDENSAIDTNSPSDTNTVSEDCSSPDSQSCSIPTVPKTAGQ